MSIKTQNYKKKVKKKTLKTPYPKITIINIYYI